MDPIFHRFVKECLTIQSAAPKNSETYSKMESAWNISSTKLTSGLLKFDLKRCFFWQNAQAWLQSYPKFQKIKITSENDVRIITKRFGRSSMCSHPWKRVQRKCLPNLPSYLSNPAFGILLVFSTKEVSCPVFNASLLIGISFERLCSF